MPLGARQGLVARGDLLAKRRRLMADWAGFCTRAYDSPLEVAGPSERVLGLRRRSWGLIR
jgi:hypothetical protein